MYTVYPEPNITSKGLAEQQDCLVCSVGFYWVVRNPAKVLAQSCQDPSFGVSEPLELPSLMGKRLLLR